MLRELAEDSDTTSALSCSSSRARINLARHDLVSLRLMAYCEETGSLTAAAKQANMSLSQASYRLGMLEASLGAALFIRSRRGLTPTPAGELVARHGRTVLGALRELERSLGELGSQGEIKHAH
ncbi:MULTISPECIES: LysR family transcriptional regulator [Polaromonas]|uniref:LysR family transcriptional regulator n=1 Tax=Polaromonas aquatica TaxID=332657 RepID=A0ABW1U5H5_9BURK